LLVLLIQRDAAVPRSCESLSQSAKVLTIALCGPDVRLHTTHAALQLSITGGASII